ncbi:MAG: hypothetical protein CL840_13415 [Crocinitomicaceae bacterium]|nr:hypothetical protein [Crocinitomicaceae bacterium]
MLQKYWNYTAFVLLFSSISFMGFSWSGSDSSTNKLPPINIKASYNLGFMLAHRTKMQHIPKELTQGFEISVEKQGNNEKDWQKVYNNPTVGVSFLATGTGNYDVMGTAYGLNAYILIPIIKSNRINVLTSWGWGMGWISNKFHPVTNYKNNTIGSNLNLFAGIKLIGEFYVTPQLGVTLGASFHHWSNAAFKYPNLGLNIASANLGIKYKLQKEAKYAKLNRSEKKLLRPKEKNEVSIIPSVGFKAYNIHDNSSYPAYTLEFNYARLWSAKWKLSAGVDLIYNKAYEREIEIDPDPEVKGNSAFQTGVNVTYHQTMGTFSILLGMGAYVYDQTLQNEPVYHRFGTRFVVKDNIIISTVLHTHWARADHFKIGIGYKFRK